MRQLTILLITAALSQNAMAGTWVGPDLLNNNWSNWSLSGTNSIIKSRISGTNLHIGALNYIIFTDASYTGTATGSRSIAVTPGKRYRYNVSGKRTRSVVSEPVSSSWWTEIAGYGSTSASSSSSYQTKSITALAGGQGNGDRETGHH